jgi:tripartite ATP-independent transporter DctM subunit
MAKRGYDTRMSLGVIIGGACLAPIIPPSILAIIISTVAQISVADLFVAGIVPGLLISALMLGYILISVRINPALAPGDEAEKPRADARAIGDALLQLLPFAAVIGIVIGTIIFGIVTPTEAAAIGVACAMGVAALFRRLTCAMLVESLSSTVLITAMIMIIIASSQLFSQLLAFTGTSQALNQLVGSLPFHGLVMLFLLMLIPFVACMFLDEMAVMLMLIPIYAPLLPVLQFDPVWFWTLFLVNITLGGIVPPVGYVLFVIKGVVSDLTMGQIYLASLPFVVIYLFAMLIMAVFPEVVLVLL